jgi:hypothetical protein
VSSGDGRVDESRADEAGPAGYSDPHSGDQA